MASGDASRIWFPEIVDELRRRWRDDQSEQELVALGSALDANLQQLRTERNIQPPMMRCRQCQGRHRAAHPRVSVRAAILAAKRFEIAPPHVVASTERRWAKFRRAQSLDRYGQPANNSTRTEPDP